MNKLALRISGGWYICLGIVVFCVLWVQLEIGIPEAYAGNPHPEAVKTTARGWGDINGTLFVGLNIMLLLVSGAIADVVDKDSESPASSPSSAVLVLRAALAGNTLLSLMLLGFAIFHTVVLHHGPPPPVFVACGVSLIVSYKTRSGLLSTTTKTRIS